MQNQQEEEHSPLMLFYSYAHEDEAFLQQLKTHLSSLRRQGLINEWDDRQISPGEQWATTIDHALNTASIILLLISPDYLASDYCYAVEMQRAVERHRLGEARVIPIILRPVDWSSTPFAQLQCLPRDARSVTEWKNQDSAFLDIATGIRRAITQLQGPTRLASSSAKNREYLLKRVRDFWIDGVLEHSLYRATLITLGLNERPDAVENPFRLEMQESTLPEDSLPPGTRIIEVYDHADGRLLILGEAGSGKTTLLLELARDILDRATQNQEHPIPVVFHLSSWAVKQQPLIDWLVEELYGKYQVSHKVGQSWIARDQIAPLLDGLDEVPEQYRVACINAINDFLLPRHTIPAVVCSRSAEFAALTGLMKLHKAVVIQSLTEEQILAYVSSAGQSLEALRVVLLADPILLKLTTSPLMLNIVTLAYAGQRVEKLQTADISEARQQVFTDYVTQMLQRGQASTDYTSQQTLHWLTWLAQQMTLHNLTQFYIERMQPTWLPKGWPRWLYYGIAVKLADALLGALTGILIGGVFTYHVGALAYGLVGLVIAVLIRRRDRDMQSEANIAQSWRGFIMTTSIRNGAIIGPIIGLIIGTFYEMIKGVNLGIIDIVVNVLMGMLIGLVVGVLMSVRKIDILPVEIVLWSWQRFVKAAHLRNGILIGLFVGLLNSLVFLWIYAFIYGLFAAVVSWLLSGLVSGVSSNILDDQQRVTANQGIHRSIQNGLIVGLIVGLTTVLIVGLSIGLTYELFNLADPVVHGVVYGTIYGLGVGLVSGLLSGADAYAKHLILRLLLWRSGTAPWNYPRFLDYADKHILIHKVGGGYIFVHRLLLEYFLMRVQREGNLPFEP